MDNEYRANSFVNQNLEKLGSHLPLGLVSFTHDFINDLSLFEAHLNINSFGFNSVRTKWVLKLCKISFKISYFMM